MSVKYSTFNDGIDYLKKRRLKMNNKISLSYDTGNYFWKILHVCFIGDENDKEIIIDKNMFKEFCENIRITYSLFYEGGTHIQMLHMLKPFSMLKELALFPESIDIEHNMIKSFASYTINAIEDLVWANPIESAIVCDDFCWYDFDKDSPEDVWDRLKNIKDE